MILNSLKRKQVNDDQLWEMVNRANKLTTGSYSGWDNNAATLVPLMDRILIRAKEKEEWQVYFYTMAKLFWLIRRTSVNDIRRAFRISEMFHQDCARNLGERVGIFGREWMVDLAASILSFYIDYPQIDDTKIEQMLGIFLDYEQQYGSSWNYGDYATIMWLALINREVKLAETARKKLEKTDYSLWCYVCYYGKPMIGYYVLHNDAEGIEELISDLCERSVPAKYQWCFEKCESASAEALAGIALQHCIQYGNPIMFAQLFDKWKEVYQKPDKEETLATYYVLFHALAGDWSRSEDRLRVAEKDDQDTREKREAPLDCLYWALCWYCYFQMLDKNGIKTVRIRLGESAASGEKKEWTCLDAAAYFERLADAIGEQMDASRKRFAYARVKQTHKECLLR